MDDPFDPREGRPGKGRVSIQNLRFDEPDALSEALQTLAPGICARATRPSGFRSRIRAWSLAGEPFFTYGSTKGAALFHEGRPFGAVTIPLFSDFAVRVGSQRFDVPSGWIQVLRPDVTGELEPRDGAHVLGLAIDWAAFMKHRQAAAGAGNDVGSVPVAPVLAQSEPGSRLLSYVDRLCRELNQSGSLLYDGRVAREVVDTIGCLLAGVLHASPASRGGQADSAIARCVEEYFAENLDVPVSLSDAAIVAGTSTRSLLRAFQKTRGTSPMAFRRRRRFDAAHSALFLADRGETSVTEVARQYCFDHLGRFSVEYRALFGESPSETLRR